MHTIQRSALVMHSAQAMYELVNDVASYPTFLPWCAGAEILGQGDDWMEARVDIRKSGIRQSFITRNQLLPGQEISMSLVDGPFSELSGGWLFTPLREDACKVALDLNFEVKPGFFASALGKVFDQVALTMVDSFCKRADEIYG